MGKKATRIQAGQRKEEIKDMLTDGYSRGQIIKYARDTWGIREAQVDSYISKCNAEFEELYRENAEKKYGRALSRTQKFYRQMKKKGNDVCAVSALKELNDIEGVKKTLVEHTGQSTVKLVYNLEEE